MLALRGERCSNVYGLYDPCPPPPLLGVRNPEVPALTLFWHG